MTIKRHYIFIFVSVLPCCRSLQVSIPKKEYEVARGGDITLTCSFIPARPVTTTLVLTWEAYPDTAGEPMVRGLTMAAQCVVRTSSKYSLMWGVIIKGNDYLPCRGCRMGTDYKAL